MIGLRELPMFMDYGIARLMQEKTETRQKLLGTPYCMAPESIACEPVDASSDRYSLGLFYADRLEADSLTLSERQLTLLRTLRNQAALAIKRKM